MHNGNIAKQLLCLMVGKMINPQKEDKHQRHLNVGYVLGYLETLQII